MSLAATKEIPLAYSTRVEDAKSGRGEDRIRAVRLSDRAVFVVADGAGGVAGGAAAADAVCKAVVEQCRRGKVADWSGWLADLDRTMAGSGSSGLAAVVIAEAADDGLVTGASVGDCEAWAFEDGAPRNLTSGQVRKPLLGEGAALPVPFEARVVRGTLLIATDGLWKYMSRDRIAKAASIRPLEAAAASLVDSVRLKSGALQDDVAVVICEVRY
jgi:serine/threonine protein phosphatase PrpC